MLPGQILNKDCQPLKLSVLVAAGVLALYTPTAQAELTSAERGKVIYSTGASPAGRDMYAIVGDEAARLPASALPCMSCHGDDGKGREEGGVLPPDIRWSQLTKTYGHVHEDGRRHTAFDDSGFSTLIAGGIDPSGNRTDSAMPMYQMSNQDMADLVAYMKELESDLDPGIWADRVQVGSLLPLTGDSAPLGQAMAQVLQAYFEDINTTGGIFGRRIELLNVPFGTSPEASIDNLQKAVQSEGLFAVVGGYSVGIDEPLLELARQESLPLIAPFTLDPGDAFVDAGAFYLYSGFAEQARVLARQAIDEGANDKQILVVGPRNQRTDRIIAAVGDQLRLQSAGQPTVIRYPEKAFSLLSVIEEARKVNAQAVLFFGNHDELQVTLQTLAQGPGEEPRVYLLSALTTGPLYSAPAEFDGRIVVAYPTYSSDVSDKGRQSYLALAEQYGLPREYMQAQIATLAAAKLFVEGLRRAGRDVSRRKVMESIESLYVFETGLTPALSFGPNRRIGALGAHLFTVDLANRRYMPFDGGWHELY